MKRELLFSFVGHVALFAVIGLVTGLQLRRDTRRPQVFTISIIDPGSSQPAVEEPRPHLVEPKPKAQERPKPKPEPRKPEEPKVVRNKLGLGARLEGADALGYSYYLNIILSKIAENWYNPYAGQALTFRATVYFMIEKDGAIKEVKLEKGSGNSSYDASCTRALLATERLPQLPPEFTGDRLKLHLEFEYKP